MDQNDDTRGDKRAVAALEAELDWHEQALLTWKMCIVLCFVPLVSGIFLWPRAVGVVLVVAGIGACCLDVWKIFAHLLATMRYRRLLASANDEKVHWHTGYLTGTAKEREATASLWRQLWG